MGRANPVQIDQTSGLSKEPKLSSLALFRNWQLQAGRNCETRCKLGSGAFRPTEAKIQNTENVPFYYLAR